MFFILKNIDNFVVDFGNNCVMIGSIIVDMDLILSSLAQLTFISS